jgi:hypothetical protein
LYLDRHNPQLRYKILFLLSILESSFATLHQCVYNLGRKKIGRTGVYHQDLRSSTDIRKEVAEQAVR